MTGPLRCDVLVVGAGPAGSAAAAALALRGRDVLLVDAHHHPRPKACAEYASPRIADELASLGIASATWRSAAAAVHGMRVIRGSDAVEIGYADERGARTAWGLDRMAFDALLATHAVGLGARLEEGATFEEIVERDGRVRGAVVRTRNGRIPVECRWLIGADGARSRVASQLGVRRTVRAPRRLGLVAHYEGVPALRDHGEMHVGAHGYVGLAPLPGGRLNVGMALPLERGGGARARFDAAIASLPAVAERLAGRERLGAIRGAAPIGCRVSEVAGPGWMLVGDAAGFIDPFTGEGIYRALRSGRAAADALATGEEAAAAWYRADRREIFGTKDRLTWLVQGMLAAGPVMGYALRRLARRSDAARLLGAALGDCRPAADAVSPRFLFEVLRP